MEERTIYNCHIHTFTSQHAPQNFLKLFAGPVFGPILSSLLRNATVANTVTKLAPSIGPFSKNDLVERQARFFTRGRSDKQIDVFEVVEKQYPKGTYFVVLPMDMAFMNLGDIPVSIDRQHSELLELVTKHKKNVIPFYAADPRREDLVEQVRANLKPGKFRGIKIYPNLGYYPHDKKLMKVYEICVEQDVPVMTHCSPTGIWQYRLKPEDSMRFGHPKNYEIVLKTFPTLRYCLAHFGGSEEWNKHLKSRTEHEGDDRAWIRWITDMIKSDDFPNLYTDISYTVFQPRVKGLYFDYFDYLKVLLSNEKIQNRVLYGSDYYMVEREQLTEKEVSILLRSRLGEELYFKIAHDNPVRYLGIKEKKLKTGKARKGTKNK